MQYAGTLLARVLKHCRIREFWLKLMERQWEYTINEK